jgi:UDP-N-acetylglucosamine--N-acetylmuramyl-(pentapeptide) pyrophosphoryl-undecaprenol N-acetylglucosamine transferase
MVTVLMAAGGTGGHIFPALALADEIRKREPGAKIIFCSTKRDIKNKSAAENRYEKIILPAVGMPRKFSPKMIVFGCKILASIVKSFLEICRKKPDAVIGFGGYVSVGPVIAARVLGVPVFLHEANLVFGRANRVLKRCASSVMINLPGDGPDFDNCIEVGMPLREEFSGPVEMKRSREKLGLDSDLPLIAIAGGSQGAHRINEVVVQMAEKFPDRLRRYQFLHLTGKSDYSRVREQYEKVGLKVSVREFEPLMKDVIDSADIVVCRSGASTIAELCARGKPAILVPYPFAADGHQSVNARQMQRFGAAVVMEEDVLDEEALSAILNELLNDREKLKRMGLKAMELGRHNAAGKMAEVILCVVSHKKCRKIAK